jgi:uncharacterized protein (TIGR02231 family)
MPNLQSFPVDIVVYPDRARLTRRGTVALEAGVHRLEFTELPARLDPQSLRAAARSTAPARLLGVDARRVFFAETHQEEARSLEHELESQQEELRLLEARLDTLHSTRSALVGISSQVQTFALALASGEMSVQAGIDMLDGLRAQAEKMDAELAAAETRKRGLERSIQRLKNELDRWRSSGRREAYTATVELEALEGGEFTLDLTYVVSGASWQPLYDIRFSEKKGSEGAGHGLEISYLGQVSQHTGEHWTDVRLTLSTARPALAATPPELDPWFIHPILPPVPMPRSAPQVHMMASMQVESAGAYKTEQVVMDADMPAAEVGEAGAAVTYTIPGKVTVPGDGASHKVAVAQLRLKPRLDYASAPRLVEAVYRRVRTVNDSEYTLLPGQANLFSDDDFIGSTPLELTAPQGEIEIYLGVDDRVRVERELDRRDVEKRLIGSKRQIRYAYRITVENLLSVRAALSVRDALPVGRHENIDVRLDQAEPKPTEHTDLNLLTWELELAPAEKRQLRYAFTVEHPREMEVAGLP